MTWLYVVIAVVAVLVLIGIPVVRALRFRPKKKRRIPIFPYSATNRRRFPTSRR